jgi:U3 small nucleolar RNA-associated protein 22
VSLQSCFHEKDYLNHRYHVKRALYLAVLKKALAKCACISSIKWSTFCDDARKPVLLLFPAPDAKGSTSKSVIRILPTISSETFSVNKLGPSKNNVRSAVSQGCLLLLISTFFSWIHFLSLFFLEYLKLL